MVTFRTRLAECLDKKQITPAELSRLTKLSKATISMYLSGKIEPKQSSIYTIARALNVSIEYLMGYELNPEDIMVQPYYLDKLTFMLKDLTERDREKAYKILCVVFDRQ